MREFAVPAGLIALVVLGVAGVWTLAVILR